VRRHEAGFNLIEVMVALLVLAFGLLGLAALQNLSLRATHQSFQRTQATVGVYDIIDRMRANGFAVTAGNYVTGGWVSSLTAPTDCSTATCSANDMATYDISTWLGNLRDMKSVGPTGEVQISSVSAAPPLFQIGVRWMEGDLQMVQTMTVELP
jgi:type IV pilus assembly protein PilV